jgi:cytochrome d ubiquinol oxidase subunit I
VTAGQVLTSIALFGAIYLLLGALWLFVLNRKIQHGPDEAVAPARRGSLGEAAGTLLDHRGGLAEGGRP